MIEAGEKNINSDTSKRLFLACWPDQSLQELLYGLSRRLQTEHGGRQTKRENIHLTLIFIGQVYQQKEQQLRQQLRLLDIKQFELELDQTGSFTHCRINWIGPSIVPEGLRELRATLKQMSQELGFHNDERLYRPHISLLRGSGSKSDSKSNSRSERAIKAVHWEVDRFCLIESRQKRDGVEYRMIEEFPLKKENSN